MNVKPIYFDIILVVSGNPMVQKNNIKIMTRMSKGGKIMRFIGHTAKMEVFRDKAAIEMYNQYTKQGYHQPINYLTSMDFDFYVNKASEADVDNLPSIFLDALQGVKEKKSKLKMAITLSDDKLVREIRSRKIVKGDRKYYGEPRTEIRVRRYQD